MALCTSTASVTGAEQLTQLALSLFVVRRFRSMNTDVEITASDPFAAQHVGEAESLFYEIERRFSRFDSASELSMLNATLDDACAVSDTMLRLLELSLEYQRLTRGLFDPAILPSLEAAGYDRSFEHVASEQHGRQSEAARSSITAISIDAEQRLVCKPPDLRLDLGGIGKGYAVDLAARRLAPARDFIINAGGDIAARGLAPDGKGWPAVVTHPLDDARDIGRLRLRDLSLATSSITARAWRSNGERAHHLIDPRTGRPSGSGLASVSVVASTTVEAEVFAKAALIAGIAEGFELLEERGLGGLFVLETGGVSTTPAWPDQGRDWEA